MKFDVLCSVAHNLADSLGSGASSVFNFWDDLVYRDAQQSIERLIEIDLLDGKVLAGSPSNALQEVASNSPRALASLCAAQGIDPAAYRKLSARYAVTESGRQFTVTIEDQSGRQRSTGYDGISGKRLKSSEHPPIA